MPKLDVVVPDFFVGQCLVSLGELDPILVDAFDGLIPGLVRSSFVGVVYAREVSIPLVDLLLT